MNIKKIAAAAAAAIMALGVCTGVPMGTDNASPLAVTASAELICGGNLNAKATYSGISFELSWEKVDNAKGYLVVVAYSTSDLKESKDNAVYFAQGNMRKDIFSTSVPLEGLPIAINDKPCNYWVAIGAMSSDNKVIVEHDFYFDSFSDLEKTKYNADGTVDYSLDTTKPTETEKKTETKADSKKTNNANPLNLKLSVYDDGTVDVMWDEVDGAYKYNIYAYYDLTTPLDDVDVSLVAKKDSNGIKAISSPKYTVDISKLPKGKTAKIQIVAFDKDGKNMGIYQNIELKDNFKVNKRGAAKTAAPANFKAKKTNSSVTLSWDAVEGADMYRVYKYNPETKKYEKYKDVKNAKCTIKGLEANTKYKFKVVSYDKNENGKYVKGESSKAVSVTTKK